MKFEKMKIAHIIIYKTFCMIVIFIYDYI